MLKSYRKEKNLEPSLEVALATLASHLWIIYKIYKSKKNILKHSNVINTE